MIFTSRSPCEKIVAGDIREYYNREVKTEKHKLRSNNYEIRTEKQKLRSSSREVIFVNTYTAEKVFLVFK